MSEVETYLRGEYAVSPQTQALIWRAIQPAPTVSGKMPPPSAYDGIEAAHSIIDSYTKKVEKTDLARQVLAANIGVVKWAANAGAAAAKGTCGQALIVGAATAAIEWGLDETLKAFDTKANDEALALLGHGLDKARQNGLKFEDLQGLKSSDAFDRVFSNQPEFQLSLEKIKPEHRDFVIGRMSARLHDAVVSGTILQLKIAEMNTQQLEKARQGLADLTEGLSDFAQKTNDRLGAIQATQDSMGKGVESLTAKATVGNQKLSLIEGYMFKGMSVSDKIAALESGWLGMSEPERAENLQLLKATEKKELAAKQFESYFSDATQLLQLGKKLGATGPLMKFADTALPLVDSLVHKIGPAVASGNVIQIASAIAGLLGGGGVDPETARHNEVMGALQAIHGQLDKLSQKVDQVIFLQQKTIEGIETISHQIVALGDDIKRVEAEVVGKLDELSADIGFLTELVVDQKGLKAADTFLQGRSKFKGFNGQRFTDYQSLWNHFKHQEIYLTAWNAFVAVINVNKEEGANTAFFQQIIEAKAHSGNAALLAAGEPLEGKTRTELLEIAGKTRTELYVPGVSLVQVCLNTFKEDEEVAWLRFLVPAEDCSDLDALAGVIPSVRAKTIAPMTVHMQNMLAPSIVKHLCEGLLDLYVPYQEVAANLGESLLLTIPQLMENGREVGGRGTSAILDAAHVITSVSLAQLNLLSGHMLLPLIKRVYESSSSIPRDRENREKLIGIFEGLLKINDVMRRNWVVYMLHARMSGDPTWLIRYAVTRSLAYPDSGLSDLLPEGWHLTPPARDAGQPPWQVEFRGVPQPLPSPEEVESGTLQYAAIRRSLLDVNERLVDTISSYSLELDDRYQAFMPRFAARLS